MPSSAPPHRTLFQAYEWHTKSTPPAPHETHAITSHYARLRRLLPTLVDLGFTDVWLPPGCKANNPQGNGFDCYDLWDLGEFDQKWARSTRWGSREELDDLVQTAHTLGLKLIWDAVLNHKTAGDDTEECWAVEVDPHDRRRDICSPRQIKAWLKYDFPGRGDAYSSLKWRAEHFSGTDWDQSGEKNAIYKLIDPPGSSAQLERRRSWFRRLGTARATKHGRLPPRSGWAKDVDDEHGNNDYLMFSNIDYSHPAVCEDVKQWALWMLRDISIDGFRLDAAQHISMMFMRDLLKHIRKHSDDPLVIGEVWTGDVRRIVKWLDAVGDSVLAFDSPLLIAFSRLSSALADDSHYNLRTIERQTLLERRPKSAVTVVTNHDTQPGQASFAPMTDQIRCLAYAYILLRKSGLPCVFWGDLYGISEGTPTGPRCVQTSQDILPSLLVVRKLYALGPQQDFLHDPGRIAWTRSGTGGRSGCVVVVNVTSSPAMHYKMIRFGQPGQTFIDVIQSERMTAIIGMNGKASFGCRSNCIAVYVDAADSAVARFPIQLDLNAAA